MSTRPQLTSTPITEELLRGALELERTAHGLLPHRLPARARAQNTDGQLVMAEAQPSGVRIVLRTRATLVELDTLPTKRVYVGAPPRPDGVYDLLVDGRLAGRTGVSGGNTLMIDMAAGTAESRPGPVGTVRFSGLSAEVKDVEIWLPHNETTELVALRTDAPVEPVTALTVRCGCTTAVRSVTAPTPPAPPPPGPRSPPRSAGWSWSTWASRVAPCSTRSPPAPCATRPPT